MAWKKKGIETKMNQKLTLCQGICISQREQLTNWQVNLRYFILPNLFAGGCLSSSENTVESNLNKQLFCFVSTFTGTPGRDSHFQDTLSLLLLPLRFSPQLPQ